MGANVNILQWVRSSIAAQLLLATAGASLIILAAFSARAYYNTDQAIERTVKADMHRVGVSTARSISNWFDGRELLIQSANEAVERVPDKKLSEDVFHRQSLTRSFYRTYFGSARDGAVHSYPAIPNLPKDYDPRVRPWYQDAEREKGTILTDPYIDASAKTEMVSLAVPLYSNGILRGVTGTDFSTTALSRMLGQTDLPKKGYAFLVNRKGIILVHPDASFVGKGMERVFDGQSPRIGDALGVVSENGVKQLVAFDPIPGLPSANWYVGIVLDRSAVYADFERERLAAIVSVAVTTLVSLIVIGTVLAHLVLIPLKSITASVRAIASGSFDGSIDYTDRADEIGEMARAVQKSRESALRIAELTEAEASRLVRDSEARSQMMSNLRNAFGEVVEAAVKGDFRRTVNEDFDDEEMNALARSINRLVETTGCGLTETARVLAALARTDLTVRVEGDYQGAFADLKTDTNAVADRLSEVISQLQPIARHLNGSTTHLLHGAKELSDRTKEQAAAVEFTSGSLQQLTIAVAANATHAEAARQKAHAATATADETSRVMASAGQAMTRMIASSDTISNVITLIDEIASRTGLVALNASIEAARAGEAGKSFAVVAVEVKELAQRVASAATEVRRLIDRSAAEIASGPQMLAQAEQRISALIKSVSENKRLVDEITNATHSQANSIDEIGSAVRQIDNVTKVNAALAQDIRAAMANAHARAMELDSIANVFLLSDRDGPQIARAAV